MSTTIKRIALVAVAALGLGVVSVAPSQAVDNNVLVTFTAGDGSPVAPYNTGNGVAGAFNYVTVTANTSAGSTDYVVTTDSTFGAASQTSVISTDKKSLVSSVTANVIQVATPAVGTVTVSYWKRTGGVLAATAAETVVITVNAAKQSGSFSAANSTAYIVKGETSTALSATADVAVTDLATADAAEASASIGVTLKDALKAAYNDTVTATVVSGGANVRVINYVDSTTTLTDNVTPGTFSANALTTAGTALVFVHANGTSGPSKIKLTLSDGTVIGEKTITFSSTTVATLTPTVVYKYVNGTKTGAVTVVAKDGQGYVVPGAAVTATSATTTKISTVTCTGTTDEDGEISCDAVAVAAAAGDSVITFKSGVATATATLTAAGVVATKLTITPDVTSAEAGAKVTFTLAVADANGPIADGVYVAKFFSAPVTSNGGTGAFAADTVTVLNGAATSEIYLPFVSGNYTSTWTLKGTAGAASDNLDKTLTATKIVSTIAVTNAGVDAATEAANEAAQAASDATDAALAAADAADAATTKAQEAVDAVATLSAEVTKLVTALKAQITTLSNLVTKIAKKVKA